MNASSKVQECTISIRKSYIVTCEDLARLRRNQELTILGL